MRIIFSSLWQDHGPGVDEFLQTPGGIRRAGRRKADRLAAGRRLDVFMVHVPGCLAVAEDVFDRCRLQDRGQIIWDHIFDTGIG